MSSCLCFTLIADDSSAYHVLTGKLEGSYINLRAFKLAFGKSKVKCVDANSRDIVYLFTDAHYEGGAGGLGAVLYDEQGRVASWLGQPLSTEECAALNVQDAEQII